MTFLTRNQLDLLWQLIKTNFKMRYQNSLLGVLWVLVRPYSTFVVLYLIWSRFGQQTDIRNYQLYLLLGIVFYTYFQELLTFGQVSLLDKAHIILKVNFPRQIAVISSLINAVVNLGINTALIFIIILFSSVTLTLIGVLEFIFLALIVFIFCLGLSFFLSILTIRLRDLENILSLGLFLLYWASPIFYKAEASLLGSTVTNLIASSPIAVILGQARISLGIQDGFFNWPLMLLYLIASILISMLGWVYFKVQVKQIAEHF